MAVGAHARRRDGHAPDAGRRRRDRLRCGLRRARSHLPGACGRDVPEPRRGDQGKAQGAALERRGAGAGDRQVARGARPDGAGATLRAARGRRPEHRVRRQGAARRAAARHLPGPPAKRHRARGGRCRTRALHHQARARRHRAPRADRHARRGHHPAVAHARAFAGRHRLRRDPDQDGRGRIQSLALRGLEIPTDAWGQLWVHFGPHDKARYVSAKDLLAGTVPPDRFRGRLVLVGTSAVGLLDLKTTPVEPAMPGVEVHAQLLESMLSRTVLSSPSYATLAELATALLVGVAIIALAPVLSAWALFGVGGVIAATLAGASWYYFSKLNLLIDPSFPLPSLNRSV